MMNRFYSQYKVKQPLLKKKASKHCSATLDDLPTEILLKIFSFLSVRSLQNATLVCKNWRSIANDDCLWENHFKTYFGGKTKSMYVKLKTLSLDSYLIDKGIQWKKEFLSQCQIQTKKVISKLKNSAYTGLIDNVDLFLTSYGIKFLLCITDTDKTKYWFSVSKRNSNRSSTYVQWNSLDKFPLLSKMYKIEVFAVTPMILLQKKKSLPLKKALVFSLSFDKDAQFQTAAHDVKNGLTLKIHLNLITAVWTDSNDIAFVSIGLHHHKLIERSFLSTLEMVYSSPHKPILDDVDRSYGLHGYKCHLLVHTVEKTLGEYRFSYLSCNADAQSGFLILKPDLSVGETFTSANFKWKTDTFTGAFDDIALVDVTMVDCNNEVIWAQSFVSQMQETPVESVSFNSSGPLYVLRCKDHEGFVSVTFSKGENTAAPQIVFGLSLAMINEWFGRKEFC